MNIKKKKYALLRTTSALVLSLVFIPVNLLAQFYVATNGNDTNSGTSPTQAFATLEAAQTAMRKSSVKTTYIRAGVYSSFSHHHGDWGFTYALILGPSDTGETWSYYPPDGYNSAILDGGSTSPETGLGCMICIACSGVKWNGIQIQNFNWNGIFVDHAFNTTITNSIIKNGTYNKNGNDAKKYPPNAGAIFALQSPNLMISNNVVYNIAYCGIQVVSTDSGGINNTTFRNNVILKTMIGIQNGAPIADGGAIYIQDKTQSSTDIIVKNNFIRDYGSTGSQSKALYFDDGTSNVIASGNIIAGTGQYAIQYHGGSNVVVSGNIIDLESTGDQYIALYQSDGNGNLMRGNTFTNNIVIAGSSSGSNGWRGSGVFNMPTIKDNVYYNYVGTSVNAAGSGMNGDVNPINEDALICGRLYTINPASPVFKSPVNFLPIVGSWGPPGYKISFEGTTSSCPLCR